MHTDVRFANFFSGGFITAIAVNPSGAWPRPAGRKLERRTSVQCTEVRFASFLFGGFATMALINPPERKLAKPTSVQCIAVSKSIKK